MYQQRASNVKEKRSQAMVMSFIRSFLGSTTRSA